MSEPLIHWKIERMDEGEEPDLRLAECLLEIEGRIECGGQTAGLVEAQYIYSEDPTSDAAFFELWDLDAAACAVFEEIMDHECGDFLDPIPGFLDPSSGILCVRFIALRTPFRRIGLGRAVMRELVHTLADPRIGLVLLDARPLQHRPHGYDDFDDEVRDLPWNSPDEDREALMRHFETWGMQRLPGTRFMMASPDALRDKRTPQWPPGPILDQWHTCTACGGWIDREGGDWLDGEYGPVHKDCV
jgi:GNAT superfamily N-acetyltransferase